MKSDLSGVSQRTSRRRRQEISPSGSSPSFSLPPPSLQTFDPLSENLTLATVMPETESEETQSSSDTVVPETEFPSTFNSEETQSSPFKVVPKTEFSNSRIMSVPDIEDLGFPWNATVPDSEDECDEVVAGWNRRKDVEDKPKGWMSRIRYRHIYNRPMVCDREEGYGSLRGSQVLEGEDEMMRILLPLLFKW